MTVMPMMMLMLAALLAGAGPARAGGAAVTTPADTILAVPVVSMREMPFRTVVRQQFDYSCGSAAVATLLTYHYHRPTAEAEVFRAMFAHGDQDKIRRQGFSLLDMKTYLTALGYAADGYRMPYARLAELKVPTIALITVGGYRHFVVIKAVDADRVLIGDPASGVRAQRRAAFEAAWSGVVFAIHDTAQPVRYDDPAEWRQTARLPVEVVERPGALSDLLLGLAYPAQVSTNFSLNQYINSP